MLGALVLKRIPTRLGDDIMRAARQLKPTQLTVDEISTLSEVPRATVYYYFSGSVALVDFVIGTLLDELGNLLAVSNPASSDPVELIRRVISVTVATLADEPHLAVHLPPALAQPNRYPSTTAAAATTIVERLRTGLKAGHETGVFTIADLDVAVDTIVGAIIHGAAGRSAAPTEDSLGDTVADQILNGLKARTGPSI